MRTFIASSVLAAALFSAPVIATAQTGNFCLRSASSGATNCIYQTMAQCQQAMQGMTASTCEARAETTGTGAAGTADKPSGGTMGTPKR